MITQDTYVLKGPCDGSHWWKRPTLYIRAKNKTDSRRRMKELAWQMHAGKRAGQLSCPKCAHRRTVSKKSQESKP